VLDSSIRINVRFRPGRWAAVIILVIVVLVTLRVAPGTAFPIGLGGLLATAAGGQARAIGRAC